MTTHKIARQDLGQVLDKWNQGFNVLVPSRESGRALWAGWDGSDISFLDWYKNTVIPAKANLLPPTEEMFAFKNNGDGYHMEPPNLDRPKQLIFAVRPCDAKAIAILDEFFEDTCADPYYLSRRNNTVLVGLGCTSPCESCFCTSLGISPGQSGDVDVMVTDTGDHLLLEAVTAAGKELIAAAGELTRATKADEAKAKAKKEAVYQKVTRAIDMENIEKKLLTCFEDAEHWEKVAAKCISCGICTLLCPTCYCFDINDELTKQQGARCRNWDSCAFPIYTKMPMENPREEKWRRVRQKVCHKFEFYPMSFNVIACVGCGRCVRLCPVNWDITQVLSNLPAGAAAKEGS
ncbi:MAG: 4Fe-4S dicluster domain-containing protein [Chloroflexota bacterium]